MRPDPRSAPLYHRVNTRTHGVRHDTGTSGDDRHERNTRVEAQSDATTKSMPSGRRQGLD